MLHDDNPQVRRTTGAILRPLGYEVTAVGDGAAALEQLDGSFDLLASNVVLVGEESGVDVSREARARIPNLGVLLITGYAPEEVGGPADQAVLRKPYSADDLARAVRQALGNQHTAPRLGIH